MSLQTVPREPGVLKSSAEVSRRFRNASAPICASGTAAIATTTQTTMTRAAGGRDRVHNHNVAATPATPSPMPALDIETNSPASPVTRVSKYNRLRLPCVLNVRTSQDTPDGCLRGIPATHNAAPQGSAMAR